LKPIADKIVSVDAHAPKGDVIYRAAAIIGKGGVVVCPTRGLYGLAVDALNTAALQKIFRVKVRDPDKPLLVLVHQRALLSKLAAEVSPMSRNLMDLFWPGKITLVMTAVPGLPVGLVSKQGKIGIRLAGHPVAAALAKAVGGPITGTSANLSGHGGCTDIDLLQPAVLDAVDLVLDAGRLKGEPSTVVDAGGRTPVVLREGAVPAAEIMRAFLLFSQRTKPTGE